MTEGLGSNCFTVLMCPRPFTTRSALPARSKPTALRVVQTLIGSKLALSTSTGSCILCLHNRQNYTADFLNSENTLRSLQHKKQENIPVFTFTSEPIDLA